MSANPPGPMAQPGMVAVTEVCYNRHCVDFGTVKVSTIDQMEVDNYSSSRDYRRQNFSPAQSLQRVLSILHTYPRPLRNPNVRGEQGQIAFMVQLKMWSEAVDTILLAELEAAKLDLMDARDIDEWNETHPAPAPQSTETVAFDVAHGNKHYSFKLGGFTTEPGDHTDEVYVYELSIADIDDEGDDNSVLQEMVENGARCVGVCRDRSVAEGMLGLDESGYYLQLNNRERRYIENPASIVQSGDTTLEDGSTRWRVEREHKCEECSSPHLVLWWPDNKLMGIAYYKCALSACELGGKIFKTLVDDHVSMGLRPDVSPGSIPARPGEVLMVEDGSNRVPLALKALLQQMRVKLSGQQLRTLDELGSGGVVAVYDVQGSMIGRYKEGPQSMLYDPQRLMITSGDIAVDCIRFLSNELPKLSVHVRRQVMIDELNMYLQARGWRPDEIEPALQKSLQIYDDAIAESLPENQIQTIDLSGQAKGGGTVSVNGGALYEVDQDGNIGDLVQGDVSGTSGANSGELGAYSGSSDTDLSGSDSTSTHRQPGLSGDHDTSVPAKSEGGWDMATGDSQSVSAEVRNGEIERLIFDDPMMPTPTPREDANADGGTNETTDASSSPD
jgi:hypothetical protein